MAAADVATVDGLDDPDDHVEAHVHGPVVVVRDVEAVVIDPRFADGPVHVATVRLGPDVRLHPGSRVATADLGDDDRGAGPLLPGPSVRSSRPTSWAPQPGTGATTRSW